MVIEVTQTMQAYSIPSDATDPHKLPDIEVFQLTAEEVIESGEYEDEVFDYLKRFPLATFNSWDRDKMLSAMISDLGIEGGWFWHTCYPSCLPEGPMSVPFETQQEAIANARDYGD